MTALARSRPAVVLTLALITALAPGCTPARGVLRHPAEPPPAASEPAPPGDDLLRLLDDLEQDLQTVDPLDDLL
jgi:hypothetical protein